MLRPRVAEGWQVDAGRLDRQQTRVGADIAIESPRIAQLWDQMQVGPARLVAERERPVLSPTGERGFRVVGSAAAKLGRLDELDGVAIRVLEPR